MKIELEDISHGKDRKDWTYDHDCTLKVKRTDDSGSVTEDEEYGYLVQGKDMIFLNSQKVYIPNLPTEHQDIAGAFEEVLGKLQDGEGGDWQPPDWWIPVPEPKEYEIYILVLVGGYFKSVSLDFVDVSTGAYEPRNIVCDWGDGTSDSYTDAFSNPAHTYDTAGQYLIKITTDSSASWLRSASTYNGAFWQIFKSGSGIAFVSEYNESTGGTYSPLFANRTGLHYIKVCHKEGLPISKTESYFSYDYNLKKVEQAKNFSGKILRSAFYYCYAMSDFRKFENAEIIDTRAFGGCYGMKTFNSPQCASIGKYAFQDCYRLEKIIAPNCTFIDERAFENCYNLQEIVVADNCTFGTNCFQNCYSLFPRPDGSVN